MAEPLVNTIKTPNINKTIINGNSQNFLRTFKNAHKSFKKSIRIISKMVFPNRQLQMSGYGFS